jgi:hypothetical protein
VSSSHLLNLRCSYPKAFGSALTKRFENEHDASLSSDLQTQIRGLPLLSSSTLTAKQDELDTLGTDLWNLSTRLRRDEPLTSSGKSKDSAANKDRAICLLRTFAFLLLDSSVAQAKGRPRKSCIRLLKVALKAARVCIEKKELSNATKILERAAEYQDVLSKETNGSDGDEGEAAHRLRMEYFSVRTTLVGGLVPMRTQHGESVTNSSHQAWRQERVDTAEHMYAKCKQFTDALTPRSAETLADLLYEIGKDSLKKNNHEAAICWLERAYDTLGEQNMELLSPEAGELRLSAMHSISMRSAVLAEDRPNAICSPSTSENQHDGAAG